MADQTTLHASCVSLGGRAVLIRGASGQGKSALALQLMAFGCDLVADDQTQLFRKRGGLWASAPAAITGLIEARGIGVLRATSLSAVQLHLIIDMDVLETDRLPVAHEREILGMTLPCLHKVDSPSFPAAVLQYLKSGRRAP